MTWTRPSPASCVVGCADKEPGFGVLVGERQRRVGCRCACRRRNSTVGMPSWRAHFLPVSLCRRNRLFGSLRLKPVTSTPSVVIVLDQRMHGAELAGAIVPHRRADPVGVILIAGLPSLFLNGMAGLVVGQGRSVAHGGDRTRWTSLRRAGPIVGSRAGEELRVRILADVVGRGCARRCWARSTQHVGMQADERFGMARWVDQRRAHRAGPARHRRAQRRSACAWRTAAAARSA